MKKFAKFCLKLSIGCFLVGILCVLLIMYHNETSINKVLSRTQQEWLFNTIDTTEVLPENYYRTLEKYYPSYFTTSAWESVFAQLFNVDGYHCQCREIYLPYIPGEVLEYKRSIFRNTSLVIALELEDRFTEKQCYAFENSNAEFGSNIRGVKNAARFYFGKQLEELNEREILSLNLIRQAPERFNPFINKERLEKALDKLMKDKTQ